ncbi:MAG TPA: hypothetical protein VFR43_08715 [Gaiellaceae bacterium]|nr:hypothetical protein [Gaiellaceae bacterium]
MADRGKWTDVFADGKVIVVLAALGVLCLVTIVGLALVDASSDRLALLTAALGVIGTVVGAFFGIKVTDDSRRETADLLERMLANDLAPPRHERTAE